MTTSSIDYGLMRGRAVVEELAILSARLAGKEDITTMRLEAREIQLLFSG